MGNFFKDLLITAVVAAVFFVLLRLVVANYNVDSPTMEPGLESGQRVLVNKLAYHFDAPVRGDIVYYTSAEGDGDQLKRIIGMPGDYIEVKNSSIYVNNVRLTEPYVDESTAYTMPSYQVPPDHFFLVADNRETSDGVLVGWTVPRGDIEGRAWFLSWPPDRWGDAGNYALEEQFAAAEAGMVGSTD